MGQRLGFGGRARTVGRGRETASEHEHAGSAQRVGWNPVSFLLLPITALYRSTSDPIPEVHLAGLLPPQSSSPWQTESTTDLPKYLYIPCSAQVSQRGSRDEQSRTACSLTLSGLCIRERESNERWWERSTASGLWYIAVVVSILCKSRERRESGRSRVGGFALPEMTEHVGIDAELSRSAARACRVGPEMVDTTEGLQGYQRDP